MLGQFSVATFYRAKRFPVEARLAGGETAAERIFANDVVFAKKNFAVVEDVVVLRKVGLT